MTVKYYDIGLNLFCKQFPEPEKIINEAAKVGVLCILTGTDRKENKQIDAFVKEHEAFGTAGIHPHNADSAKQEDFEIIERIISENKKIVAVGECGLDYDRMFSTKENQIRCLEKHIVLAEKLDKPLFLHERMATEDFVKRFKKHPDICKKSVVHCFTGDKETLDKYLSMGFSIGITGWICDDSGSFFIMDLDPDQEGNVGQIITLDRESNISYVIAESFRKLLLEVIPKEFSDGNFDVDDEEAPEVLEWIDGHYFNHIKERFL